MKKDNNLHTKILNITFIALFAALCYIALMLFFFPFANMYIHFGNMIVVVASLLIGGWQGGLAGSIGMGLYDILNGHADSAPKTFILKFLIGLTVGIVFTLLNNRKKYPVVSLVSSGSVSLLISIGLLLHTFINNSGYGGKAVVLAPLFAIVGIGIIVFACLEAKLSHRVSCAVVGAACGMLINIVGEVSWKTIQFYLAGSDFTVAFSGAVFSQGSTLINAAISIVGGVALYVSLRKPFEKILRRK